MHSQNEGGQDEIVSRHHWPYSALSKDPAKLCFNGKNQ
jgi:hypothetical protein